LNSVIKKHWARLNRSLGRRWREWRLPRGYIRLGTRYGGWWVDSKKLGLTPLLVDCGLGEDISFPIAFLARFDGHVVGIEPNPRSLAYCMPRCPQGMEILVNAFWTHAGETLTFHLPRSQSELPKGADGVSGSLLDSHEYVSGGEPLSVTTIDLDGVLSHAGRDCCEILKLDIEGAEYEVISALIETGQIRKVDQLLVEFHHGATHHALADTESTVKQLADAGFVVRHTEGRNFIFQRKPQQ
jgi:FkbM family methyltransferase